MALKLNIKPGERLFIPGGTLEIAATGTISVALNGQIAIIREGDYLPAEKVTSPARKMCFALQNVYLSAQGPSRTQEYTDALESFELVSEGVAAQLIEIDGHVRAGDIFRALKICRKVIQLEQGASDWPSVVAG